MANFSSSPELLRCYFLEVNWENPTYVYVMGVVTSLLNAAFTFTAITGNTVVIIAVWRTPSLHSPSNFLLCCLAFSDLITGMLCQPLHVLYKAAEFGGNFEIYCIGRVSMETIGWIAAAVSCVSLSVIAVERFLALHYHMRYYAIVTIPRLAITTAVLWLFFIVISVSRFFVQNTSLFTLINMSALVLSLVVTFWAYGKIFRIVKRHQRQIQSQERALNTSGNQGLNPLDMAKYKKSTYTMVYVLGLFLICYVPLFCVQVAYKMVGYTSPMKVAIQFSGTVAFMNSSFNPAVYCLRIQSLRRACLRIIPCVKSHGENNALSADNNAFRLAAANGGS